MLPYPEVRFVVYSLKLILLKIFHEKIAYDLGTPFNKNLKGQMLGFDFYKDLRISSGNKEYYFGNEKYFKNI